MKKTCTRDVKFSFQRDVSLFIVVLCIVTSASFAQDNQNSASVSSGEFGAIDTRIGTVRNATAIFVGGRGGWIINQAVAIGIGGYALVNNVPARIPDTSGNHLLTMAYGGIDVEYNLLTTGSLRITFEELLGAGSISHEEIPYLNHRQYHDPFLVFEPGLSAEFKVTRILSVGAGVSHRVVFLLSSKLASNAELGSPSGFVSLNVGLY
ncbi:MAG TPA: hypothetical protein VI758_11055 [Bacteroidota bacterium]